MHVLNGWTTLTCRFFWLSCFLPTQSASERIVEGPVFSKALCYAPNAHETPRVRVNLLPADSALVVPVSPLFLSTRAPLSNIPIATPRSSSGMISEPPTQHTCGEAKRHDENGIRTHALSDHG